MDMNDRIIIRDLEVYAHHGVYPEENKLGQKFLVSAQLFTDFSEAAETDDLSLSVDYGSVCKTISCFMQENTFRLIEAAAQELALRLLTDYPLLSGVSVEIKKPWAPIGLPLETVSAALERHWHTAYIALGSNMGDKHQYISNAVEALNNTKGCIVEKVSELIVTAPYGKVDQDDFLNGVLRLKTCLSPHRLLEQLHRIENSADRLRTVHWGPRTLDLDIIFYDNVIIDEENLHIPHIDMHNRAFVLQPLAQIAPYVRHPVLNMTVQQLLDRLKRQ
ncbi:MAG: 2-amino-4-hydroxy-6-hydroxymethyldihydropteridine diphosphokinase [Clostridia bacterium]|nr:2-amino-4-hydroxy-6-hydroxymethyldihydropteridine diphosphokinase [Clostridia bacterium]